MLYMCLVTKLSDTVNKELVEAFLIFLDYSIGWNSILLYKYLII